MMDEVLMRTYIVEYKGKTRCVSILALDIDKASILVWQHVYTDDTGEGVEVAGFRSMVLADVEVLDYSTPLMVPVSAVSPAPSP